jgi:hypothetical protein
VDVKALLARAFVFEGGVGHLVSVRRDEIQIGHVESDRLDFQRPWRHKIRILVI